MKTLIWQNQNFITKIDEWNIRNTFQQQSVNWDLDSWLESIPSQSGFLKSLYARNLGSLDRNLVRNVLHTQAQNKDYLSGFIAVMIWGYAGDKRGASRIKKIFSDVSLATSLETTYDLLQSGNIREAYEQFVRNGPKGIGPAFGTKYLYFAAPKNLNTKPLILDRLISVGLEKWSDFKINSLNASTDDYIYYLNYMKESGSKLNIGADNLELVLFSEVAKLGSNSVWASSDTSHVISAKQKLALGFSFAFELLARDPSFVLKYTEPGGGQYSCLNITHPRNSFEADLNLKGRIFLSKQEKTLLDWSYILDKGASYLGEKVSRFYDLPFLVDYKNLSNQAKSAKYVVRQLITQDLRISIVPIYKDNSACGATENTEILSKFYKQKELMNHLSKQKRELKDQSLWCLTIDENPFVLLDFSNATALHLDGTIEDIKI